MVFASYTLLGVNSQLMCLLICYYTIDVTIHWYARARKSIPLKVSMTIVYLFKISSYINVICLVWNLYLIILNGSKINKLFKIVIVLIIE